MGRLYLKNSSVIDLAEKIMQQKDEMNESLYTVFKSASIIAGSTSFRGQYADSFKNYLRDGAMNILTGMIDLGMEMGEIATLMRVMFMAYESVESGEVAQEELENIKNQLRAKENSFDGMKGTISSLTNRASRYISPVTPQTQLVNAGYNSARTGVDDISDRLETTDNDVLTNVKQLQERINTIADQMKSLMNYVYKDNTIIPENMGKITKQDWYQRSTNVGLTKMMAEDPFFHSADKVSKDSRQWAAGLTADIYAYTGYDWLTADYEILLRDGDLSVNEKASVFEASAYGQLTDAIYGEGSARVAYAEGGTRLGFSENFTGIETNLAVGLAGAEVNVQATEYLRARGNADLLFARGEGKFGFGSEFNGMHVQGEAGVAQAEGSVMIGPKWLNLELEGEAKYMCADGKVDAYFEDKNNWALGFDASATAAKAEVGGGLNIFDYETKQIGADGKKVKKTLLGLDASIGGGATTGAALYAKSENVWSGEHVNVNATTVKVKLGFILDAEVELTIPTITFNWPWEG